MELVFKEAGNVELVRLRDSARILFVGMLDKISESTTIEKTKLNNGNGRFGRSYTTGATAKITLNMNSYVPKFAEYLKGSTITDGASSTAIRVIQPIQVPTSSPYTVSLLKTPASTPNMVVQDQDETVITKGTTTPNTGEYVISGSTLTFNVAQAGTFMTVAYDMTATTAFTSSLAQGANSDAFSITVAGRAVDAKNEGTSKQWSLTYNRVLVDGDINPPEKSNVPVGWSVSFTVDDPPAGVNVYDLKIEK